MQTILASATGYVTLINQNPYDWNLTSSHSYQLQWNFPKSIPAGTSHEQYIKSKKKDHHDDSVEAYYTLVNSRSPTSSVVKARAPKHIEIEFQETLSSLNNPENSVINLGSVKHGTISLFLAGDQAPLSRRTLLLPGCNQHYRVSDPRACARLPCLLVITRACWKISFSWSGVEHNTRCQSSNIFKQLVNGARIFDVRPINYRGSFRTGHFSKFGQGMVGAAGRKLADIEKDIDSSTSQYPGKLIIFDISHHVNVDKKLRDFTPQLWVKLYEEMDKIQALWVPSSSDIPYNILMLPILTFIKPESKSAIMVILPGAAPLPGSDIKHPSVVKSDGMMAMGPDLEDDDSDASTTSIEGRAEPSPTSLLFSQTSGDDDNSENSADSSTSPDGDSSMKYLEMLLRKSLSRY